MIAILATFVFVAVLAVLAGTRAAVASVPAAGLGIVLVVVNALYDVVGVVGGKVVIIDFTYAGSSRGTRMMPGRVGSGSVCVQSSAHGNETK